MYQRPAACRSILATSRTLNSHVDTMRINRLLRRLGVAFVTAFAIIGCTLDKQEAPGLVGPSTAALSIAMTASPERLTQDGSSQSQITVETRDVSGQALANIQIRWQAVLSDGRVLTPSSVTSATDGNGRATTIITAPAAPASLPTAPVTIAVTATPLNPPLGTGATTRLVNLELIPPVGTPAANNAPVAAFTYQPSTPTINQTVLFDAATSTDEGISCGSSCTYSWVFDDGTTGSGLTAAHTYNTSGTYAVALTVRDARGGTHTVTQNVVVSASPLTATITISPTNPRTGDTVFFDGRGSRTSNGATITAYEWDFGNGQTGTGSTASGSYSAARTYTIRLTINDSLGRTATTTATVTVTVTTP